MRIPEPMECHPAYHFNQLEIQQRLYEDFPTRHSIRVVVSHRTPFLKGKYWPEIATSNLYYRELHRHRFIGLAPYVGTPFRYEWWAFIDELGRAVAGPARVVMI